MDTRFMPKAYKNAAELRSAVSAYFERCDNEEKRYGIFGLLFALGVTMEQFMRWEESGTEGFSETAKLARYHILNALETGTDGRAAV